MWFSIGYDLWQKYTINTSTSPVSKISKKQVKDINMKFSSKESLDLKQKLVKSFTWSWASNYDTIKKAEK